MNRWQVGLMVCWGGLAVVALWGWWSGAAAAAAIPGEPLAQPVLTPTPLPRRNYDPPAPSGLVWAADAAPLRVVDAEGYPRIVKLWGGYDSSVGLDFYARYRLIISESFTPQQLDELRARNPNLVILFSRVSTYDTDDGPLGSQWVYAAPGSPEFDCFYRNAAGQVIRVAEWNHGMFNMGSEYCTQAIADYLFTQFDPLRYDGAFFDRVYELITPIISGMDLNHDGLADDTTPAGRAAIDAAYYQGTLRFLTQVRAGLSERLGREAVVMGNDAPLAYADILNGREYEMNLRDILDRGDDWMWFRYNYEQWMQASRQPRLTMMMGNPPLWMRTKYGLGPYDKMKKAVVDQAAAYYQRMRFGLATALLEGGTFGFEFGDTWHGNAWWYDEFDGAGLGLGYLGQPLGEAYWAAGPLTTVNVLQNADFELPGLVSWTVRTQPGAQVAWSSVPVSATFAPPGSHLAAHVAITASGATQDVRLEQGGISLVGGQWYTLSFWGQASRPHWQVIPCLYAAGNESVWCTPTSWQVEFGTTWQQYWLSFQATATVGDAVLSLGVGSRPTGAVWLDQVSLQEGWRPLVWRRDFERGVVLGNATASRQQVTLERPFFKLNGSQAPLVQVLMDDTDPETPFFQKYGGWAGATAGYDDWGSTFHYALGTTNTLGFHSIVTWRPDIPSADWYTVHAWVAPHSNCTDTVTYTVQHASGQTTVPVGQQVAEPGWVFLGVYSFTTGMNGSVSLSNQTRAHWVVADAMRFESRRRYNDGSEVTSVWLEGQDGLILLNEPSAGRDHTLFLPLVLRDAAP